MAVNASTLSPLQPSRRWFCCHVSDTACDRTTFVDRHNRRSMVVSTQPRRRWLTGRSTSEEILFELSQQRHEQRTTQEMLRQFRGKDGGFVDYSLIDDKKGIAAITIRNSRRSNAMTGNMLSQLGDIVNFLEHAKVRVAFLQAEGTGAFCAGSDLELLNRLEPYEATLMVKYMQTLTARLRCLKTITIAKIHGPAVGGGAELATATDFRIMANSSFVQFIHARKGLSTGWGGTARLLNLVGPSRCQDILLRADQIPADVCTSLGIANSAVPLEQLDATAMELADSILEKTPDAIECAKMNTLEPYLSTLERVHETELQSFERLYAIFYEKRRRAANRSLSQ